MRAQLSAYVHTGHGCFRDKPFLSYDTLKSSGLWDNRSQECEDWKGPGQKKPKLLFFKLMLFWLWPQIFLHKSWWGMLQVRCRDHVNLGFICCDAWMQRALFWEPVTIATPLPQLQYSQHHQNKNPHQAAECRLSVSGDTSQHIFWFYKFAEGNNKPIMLGHIYEGVLGCSSVTFQHLQTQQPNSNAVQTSRHKQVARCYLLGLAAPAQAGVQTRI